MLANWHEMLPAAMKRFGRSRQELVDLFGSTRDE